MDNINVTNKINNMSEKELKFEKRSKVTVFVPLVVLITVLLFLSSCASSSYTLCDAYASVELKNELKWRNY